MTPQEIVNRWIVTMLIFAVLFALGIIAFVNLVKEEKHYSSMPICTVLYYDHDKNGNIVYANNQYECRVK